ncbi:Hypothetical protein D9617_1g084180 [Elsinoe fawcettii]|nr:Hypothetical protein D9617_1g084180 [Elsinoe fawcettii]
MLGFSNLPAELRHTIWQAALPEQLYPSIYRWQSGCWSWDEIPEDDVEYVPQFPDSMRLEFNYKEFRGPSFNAPMLYVNHESRSILLHALRKLKASLVQVKNDSNGQCQRLFNHERDVIFIPSDKLIDFSDEPENLAWEHCMDRETGKTPIAFTIALSESLIRDRGADALADVLRDEYAVWPRAIYILKMQDARASVDAASASGTIMQIANVSAWSIHWRVSARTMEVRGPCSEDATCILNNIRAICDGRPIDYDFLRDMEIPSPLLAQVPLTVSPFINLPKPPTLPHNYASLPSTLPPSILSQPTSSNPSDPSPAPPELVPYVTAPNSSFSAHPKQIIAQNRSLLSRLEATEKQAEQKMAEWERGIEERELADKRRRAPGWLDRDEKILSPARKRGEGEEGVDLLGDDAGVEGRGEGNERQGEGGGNMGGEQGGELGVMMDRAFGGLG